MLSKDSYVLLQNKIILEMAGRIKSDRGYFYRGKKTTHDRRPDRQYNLVATLETSDKAF